MMLSTYLSQAWANIRENGSAAAAGVITTSISLVILGSVVLVYLNLINLSQMIFQQANYSIFISTNTNETVRQGIIDKLKTIKGINNIRVVPAEIARKDLIESFGESGQVLEGIDLPEIPDMIEFSLDRNASLDRLEIEKIRAISDVIDVISGLETKDQVDIFFTVSEFVGVFLILLLVVSIALMLNSSIQIAVRTRIEEIEILKTLGATRWYIKTPFMIEGTLIAVIGYLLSLGITYLLYTFVIAGITFNEATYGIEKMANFFSFFQIIVVFGIIVLIGIISSSTAADKVLRELKA